MKSKKLLECIEVITYKIAKQCASDDKECIILQYGLYQGFFLILQVISLIICGIIRGDLVFILLVFIGVAIIRPYTGGYHADTEWKCYWISLGIINVVTILRKIIDFSMIMYIFWDFALVLIMWKYVPIENPIRHIEIYERKLYKKKSQKILLMYSALLLVGILTKKNIVVELVTSIVTIVAFLVVLGKLKY